MEGRQIPYDRSYFENYERLAETRTGEVITEGRVDLVTRWCNPGGHIFCDVGIGSGVFLEAMCRKNPMALFGSDVNPVAIDWLRHRGLNLPPGVKATAMTFWDVLEHIPEPSRLFRIHEPEWIFVSMPIYHNEEHVFRSKHFKPGEHCWYFTEDGLRRFMHGLGYVLIEMNAQEIVKGGREDVWAFAFQRMAL